jgi:hypothetical protein
LLFEETITEEKYFHPTMQQEKQFGHAWWSYLDKFNEPTIICKRATGGNCLIARPTKEN